MYLQKSYKIKVLGNFATLLFQGLQSEWRVVFFITIVVYVIGAIGYIILGKAETESYAQSKSQTEAAAGKPEENLPLNQSKV